MAHQTHPELLNNVLVEELCGTAVSSTQVSDGAKLLDAELPKWRDRPLDAYPYLVFDARYEKEIGRASCRERVCYAV